MRRVLLTLAAIVLLPVLLLGALATDRGLGLAAGLAAGFVPGLELEGVSGPLPGRLAVARLRMNDAQGPWLELETAELELDWRALWDRRVVMRRVSVASLTLHRLPPPGEPAAPGPPAIPSLPSLPVAIRIEALSLPRIAVLGQATLSLQGDAALEAGALQARLAARRLDAPGEARLDLAFGTALTARLDITEPAGGLLATLAGQPAADFSASLALDGPATGARWRLDTSLGATQAALSGELALAADGEIRATAAGNLSPGALLPAEFRPLAATITPSLEFRRRPDGALLLDRLSLELPALRAEGSAGLDAAQMLSGRIRVTAAPPEAFGTLLPEGLGWQALTLDLTLAGTLANPAGRVVAEITAPRGAGAADAMLGDSARLEASLSDGVVDARLTAARLAATLRGRAQKPFALDFTAEARDPPNVTGSLTAQGRITGTAAAPEAVLTLRSPRLAFQGRAAEALEFSLQASPQTITARGTGRVDARPFTLDVAAARDDFAIRISRLEAAWSGLALSGQGAGALPAGPFTGALRLEAPDLAPLGFGVSGRLNLTLEASAIPGATGPAAQGIRLRLNGQGVGVGAFRPSAQAEIDGSLALLNFRLAATAPQGGLDLAGDLTQGSDTRIILTRLEARAGEDSLRLAAPATLRAAADGTLSLESARLLGRRGGSLNIQGRLAGGQINARAELAALPLGPLSAGMVTGTASGQVTATGPTAVPNAEARIRVDALRLTDPALAGLPVAQINATARLQGQSLRAEARLTAGPGVTLNLEASQPRGLGATTAFEARLGGTLELNAISRPFLDAGGDRLTGRATLDLRATGTPTQPVLSGGVALANGSYQNPVLGARLNGITAQINAVGQRLVVQSLTARTQGGGQVSVQGFVEPLAPGIPAELRLTAEAARPVSGVLGEAILDANLALRGPLTDGGSLSGRIDIRRAEIRIPENFAGAVPSLGNVREVGPLPPGRRALTVAPPAAARPAVPMILALTIAAPRAVFIRGRGLEAELGGEISIGGSVARPEPQGMLRLRRGSFDLAGRQLQFTRGIIGFESGSFSPSLDFVATARSRAHTINLNIKGDPANPELTVTASPELPQDEALARLLFDRETSRLSPFELAGIAQAVAQLSGLQPAGGGVLGRLRSLAGLDRLGVGASAGGAGATVEAGRYIAPGVYVGVRQGTAGAAPGVGVQVELTPRLRLEGETATGPGGDRVGLTWEYEY